MSSVGTFGSFTTARLGIYAAQKGLDVTGHNIANINTRGYSRQRLDQMSLRTGGAERYNSKYDARVGSGVLCTGISQLRDPYLDIRYRNESSSVGAMDAKLAALEDLSGILDEVYKGDDHGGILEAQINEFRSQLKNLMNNVGGKEYDGMVRTAAGSLAKLLNSYSEKIDGIREDLDDDYRQDVKTVNGILQNIRDLNDTIQKSELHGDPALELRDQRNLLLDDLSQYMKISIEYEPVSVGAGATVDKMVVRMAGKPGYTLVDGSYATKLSIRKEPELNPNAAAADGSDKYLDANGNPTGDPDLANQIDSPNYNMDLAELKNSFDKAFKDVKDASKGYGTDQAGRDTAFANLTAGGNPAVKTLANGQIQSIQYDQVTTQDRDGNDVYSISITTTTTAPGAQMGDNDLYGSLQAMREMLTEAGEYTKNDALAMDPNAATKRGIPYYRNTLDSLAQKFASVFNDANTGYLQDVSGNYLGTTGAILTDPVTGDPLKKGVTPLDDPTLVASGVKVGGSGALFSNKSTGDDTTGITAANISISQSWSIGDVRIVNSFVAGAGVAGQPIAPNSGDTANILHMMNLVDSEQDYNAGDIVQGATGGVFTKGSFQEMLANTCTTLASEKRETTTQLNNYAGAATELGSSRDGVSGVDLNDEAASLMQYQKSYSAACRLMTTLDEALDKLINGTGVVGR